LERAVRAARDARVRDRIRGVIMARRGRTAPQIADDLGYSRRAVQQWVQWYNRGGLDDLPDAPRSGQPRKCPSERFEQIRARVLAGPRPEDEVCTLRGADVKRLLEKEFGVVQSLGTTYRLLHALELAPLRPRPRHVKNDPEAMRAWEDSAPPLSRASVRPTPASGSRSGSRTRRGSASRAR
jgi:transposase